MEFPLLLYGSNLTPELAISILLAVLIGMTVHEFAHNYVAHLMGDPVPAREGRLTLDPTVHIYWPGFIMFVLIGFGILGSAPISPRRMRNPRWGFLAAVAAGPFSNLLVAALFAIPYRLLTPEFGSVLFYLLWSIVFWNLLLFLFNLLPFFPIDGWHIVHRLLPSDLAYFWERNAMNTQYLLLALILIGVISPRFSLIGTIINPPLLFLQQLLLGF